MSDEKVDLPLLIKEAQYYRKKTDELAGENLKLDYAISGLRHELKQKRAGFNLLAALPGAMRAKQETLEIFQTAIAMINANLGMDKSVVLFPEGGAHLFTPAVVLGSGMDLAELSRQKLEIPPDALTNEQVVLVNKATAPQPWHDNIKKLFGLPYFVVSPVRLNGAVLGLFISGRLVEAKPLYPPLDQGDADSFVAIGSLIAATIEAMQVASMREADRLKTEFFANISHEFRTPITLTIGPLEALLGGLYGETTERIKSEIELVLRNQRRLLDLINQILDLAKLESGAARLTCQKVPDVNSFLEERIAQFQALADKRGLRLVRQFDEGAGHCDFSCDVEKLDKAIFNLMSNSLKFTKKGSVTISTALTPTHLEIAVTDTGIGIRADQVGQIFDRFRQADGSHSREFAGTGIGLSLVKQIVDVHGGTITVSSVYGEGTKFLLTFPLGQAHLPADSFRETDAGGPQPLARAPLVDIREGRASEDELGRVDELNRATTADFRKSKPVVLYVDDNADLRTFVHGLLKDQFNLYLAVNGQDGFAKAKQYHVDLVLSDLMMPVMTGSELLEKLRGDLETAEIPFVMLTARNGMDVKIAELRHGVDDFLTKPFSEAELSARIHNLLKIREQQRRIKKDLAAARLIQRSLLPSTDQRHGDVRIEVLYHPCEELSGDFFEVKTVGRDVLFYVADVTSHGTASAQVTYLLKGIFHELTANLPSNIPLPDLMMSVALAYCEFKLDYAVGLVLGKLSLDTGKLEYITSGFPTPGTTTSRGTEFLPVITNQPIDPATFEPGRPFVAGSLDLCPQESVYFFTDGTFEFVDKDSGRLLGDRRLLKIFAKHGAETEWRQRVFDDLAALNRGQHFEDDMTIFRLHRESST